ncbi:MAG: hypothetical protein KKB35_13230, partial [Proteobacteria bacterium]|nr:hypothetical protein [Pseudomonadota bacterium]
MEEKKQTFETNLDQQITEAVNRGSLQPLIDQARGLYSYVFSDSFHMGKADHVTENDIVRFEEQLVTPLATIARKHGIEVLLEGLDNGESLPLHGSIIEALATIKDPRAVESLLRASRRRYEFRKKALAAVARIKSVDVIIKILSDSYEDVTTRTIAAEILGEMGDTIVVEPLIETLNSGFNDWMLRREAATALG